MNRIDPPRGLLMQVDMGLMCVCGKRLGLHRYAGDNCPNPQWRPCNGKPEFLWTETFRMAAEQQRAAA